MKTLLIVYLMSGKFQVTFLYGMHFDTEQQCLSEVVKHTKERDGLFDAKIPQRAECVMAVKK